MRRFSIFLKAGMALLLGGGGAGIGTAIAQPVIAVSPASKTACSGNSTSFFVTATDATSYKWQMNSGTGFLDIDDDDAFSGTETSTLSIAEAGSSFNGNLFRCRATNADGSAISTAATLTVTTITHTGSQVNVYCNGGTNGKATVVPSGGTTPYYYSWSPAGGTAANATGLSAGTYTVTITDANSCTATREYIITQPEAITISGTQVNVSCNGGSNGSATATVSGGTGSYYYSWSPVGGIWPTATGFAAGTYTVTVTDDYTCTATREFTITQPDVISLSGSQVDVSCNGGTNGSATVSASGGTGSYTYSWSPYGGTAATATGLAAGTYTVTVTDANSCTKTQSFTITQPSAIATVAAAQTNVGCNGSATGAATVSASGGTGTYYYSWSPSGGTAATATGLYAGTYTVTVTDDNTCFATRSFTITQPSAIVTTAEAQTNVSCNGGTNGAATVSASGGTGSYTYSWSPYGGTAATATGLAAGTYTVTVTDANSCTKTQSFTITQPSAIATVAAAQTNVSCNGGSNGAATVSASGGTGAYYYSWSPSGGTAATATGLYAGTYTVTVTDDNTCFATRSFTITQPSAIVTTAEAQTNVSCNGGTNGAATVSASGGTGSYTYSWSPYGGTAATATGLAAGTYTVTVTDANSCTKTQSFTITQPSAIATVAAAQTNVSCNGGSNGAATVSASGGTGAYYYSWSPSGGTAATATGLYAGTYTVTVTDDNTCFATRSFTITQPSAIVATAEAQTNVSCNGSATGAATVSASGGTGAYYYSWSPSGGTAATATGLYAGTYTVTVTDDNTCFATRSFTITQPAVITGTDIQDICVGGSYIFNGVAYSEANNTAKDTLVASNGCDSIVTLNLSVTENGIADSNGSASSDQYGDAARVATEDCKLIATISSSEDLGMVTTDIVVCATVGANPFVSRYYDIQTTNPPTTGVEVTLYFTEEEINEYNALVGEDNPDHPQIGLSGENAQITAFHSLPGSGTGVGGYDTAAANVEVLPCVLTWNATESRWEAVFTTTRFSGFFLHTSADDAPLPIILNSITALNENAVNHIDWTTASEAKGDVFVIERASDGKQFRELSRVPAKEETRSAYRFTDEQPYAGMNYYRLRLLNNDGSSSFSKIVTAYVGDFGKFNLVAQPNPVAGMLQVRVEGAVSGNAMLTITDISGKVIQQVNMSTNVVFLSFDGMASGTYFIRYSDNIHTEVLRVAKD